MQAYPCLVFSLLSLGLHFGNGAILKRQITSITGAYEETTDHAEFSTKRPPHPSLFLTTTTESPFQKGLNDFFNKAVSAFQNLGKTDNFPLKLFQIGQDVLNDPEIANQGGSFITKFSTFMDKIQKGESFTVVDFGLPPKMADDLGDKMGDMFTLLEMGTDLMRDEEGRQQLFKILGDKDLLQRLFGK